MRETVSRWQARSFPEAGRAAYVCRLGVPAWLFLRVRCLRRKPDRLSYFIEQCSATGQSRPTPLLLRYRRGDYNCLHQDLYGPIVFPFQVIVALSAPDSEYRGGELLLVEQRPRARSKGHVIRLDQGEGVAITTRYRPEQGARGVYRVNVGHGVSTVYAGERFPLGVIFHDAE